MPPDRKQRMLVALVTAALVLGFMGSFFWPILKDFNRTRQNGGQPAGVPLVIFGGFFLMMVLLVVGSVVRGLGKLAKADTAGQPVRDPQPWLARADWAAGKIKSTTGAQTKIFALMALAFCGLGGFFTFAVLPKELHNGNDKALVVVLFPAVGIGFVIALVRTTLARRRFGDCCFEMASIPGALGGSLDGLIQTGGRLRLEHGLHLKLSCIRRTVSGSGNQRNVSETILWQDEKVFKTDVDLPEPEPGHSGIPVFFKLPADQPECLVRGNEAILWRLEAKAKMSGPDFAARFDVPVFQVAGGAVDEAMPDPTAALQMPVEELRRDEHSKIQVIDGPGGREFYFPAARNPGTAVGMTCFFLAWTGFTLAAYLLFKSVLFEILFTAVDVLVFMGLLNLWFKASRVTVDSTGIRAVNRWLLFTRAHHFAALDIDRMETKVGMTCGNQAYLDLKVVTRAGKACTVASGLASKPEADWLVQEMAKALGRVK